VNEEQPTYRIDLRPLPDSVPVHLRSKHLLKFALRATKLKAVSVKELPADKGDMPVEKTPGGS
jgi:hypothetical protein